MRHFLLALFYCIGSALYAQNLVYPGDFIYEGAFRLPSDTAGGSRFGYGGTAPVYHPMNNSLFMVGHDWDQKVAEVSIPALVISDDINDLNTAEMLQPFRDISEGLMYDVDEGTIKVGGLLHVEGLLVESVYSYYDADGDQILSHCTSDTNIVLINDVEGMFELGDLGAGFVSGYMTMLPMDWAEVLEGPAITGQCCIPIISRSSYGPAAFVFDPEDLGVVEPLPVTPLVYYPDDHPLSEWNSTGPYFNGSTSITGVVVPEGKRSLLFFGSHGIGEFCYGTGEECNDPVIPYQGTHAYPYVFQVWAYDLLALEEVKNGITDPWDVVPYAVWPFDFPITDGGKALGGATYDPVSGKIYVVQRFIDGNDAFPLVHAFTLRGPHLYVDAAVPAGVHNGTSWAKAYEHLQDALAVAHKGDTIHVATGHYFPDEGNGILQDDRYSSFEMADSVLILGGYPAGGGMRNPGLHHVVLSGDIDHNDVHIPAQVPGDIVGNNSYNVVTCHQGVMDGLIISGGKASGVDSLSQRAGAGVFCNGHCTFIDCRLQGNIASGNGTNGLGGGVYLAGGQLVLQNVIFEGNSATGNGKGWYAEDGGVVVEEAVEVKE